MDLKPALVAQLRNAGCVFAEDEAEVLLAAEVTPDERAELVRRRVAGEPLEQVVGWADFAGQRIVVEPGVFVPRRRTELMVRVALSRLAGRPNAVLLDLCCGSGAVAAAISRSAPEIPRPALPISRPATEIPRPATRIEVCAADCDPAAVRCARRNLPEAQVFQGELYQPLPPALAGRVDVVVANAPYVPTDAIALMPPEARLYEARRALDGGPDGVDVLRAVLAGAPQWLAPDGVLLVEAADAQLGALAEHARRHGLNPIVHSDDDLGGLVVELRR